MRKLVYLLLACPALAFAQGARIDNPGGPATRNVQNFLAPIPGATIAVCTSAGTGTPCSPLVPTSPVTLCTDATCAVAAPNPFPADTNGNWGAWLLPGTYKVSITAPGVTGSLLTVTLSTPGGGPIIAPSIGPSVSQQHTIPAVASDVFALLAAVQTLTNKTLTSPTTTGTDSGTETLANKTLTSPTSTGTDAGSETLTNKILTRVQAGTTAPTCSVTGAGTGATCSLASSSNDNSGNMQINTGTTPGTSGTWTLTFNGSWANAGFCSVSLGSANTTLNARATVFNNSNGAFLSQSGNWDNNGVAPTASQATAFLINYVCIGH